MDKTLRIFAGLIVTESEISNPAKLQLLNFIQNEATDAQVKVLLMDGEIVSLDKQAEKIVNDRFDLSEAGGKVAQFRKSAVSVVQGPQVRAAFVGIHAASGDAVGAGGAAISIGVWHLYRLIRAKYDKCTKQCGTYKLNLPKRQYCMIKCKVGKLEAQLKAAVKSKNAKEISKKKIALAKAKLALTNFKKTLK